METQGDDKKADTAQIMRATRLARDLVDCDPAILSLLVIDKSGRVIAVERSKRLSEADFLSDDLVPKFGVLAKLIIGAASNATPLLGRMEFLIGAFKNEKVILMNLSEYDLTLGMRVARSATAEYVYRKIAERLAITT